MTKRPPNPWVITWTVLAGAFAIGINFTILAVSRPAIADDLHVDASTLVWLISGPMLANALFTATAGKLGDLYGHRRVYLWGIATSVIFAVLSAVAWNSWSLVAFRVLGAVVGSAAVPASMAIINLMFEPAKRSTALGYWSLVGAGAPVVGLIIGGPLVDAFGWRTIFWIQVPLLAVAALIAWRVLPETNRATQTQFDVAGNVVLGISLVALLGAVERASSWGWGSPATIAGFAVALGAGVWFVRIEQRVEHPLIPIRYFKRRNFAVPIVVIFFAQFGYMGGFILVPRLLAEVGGESASHISTLMIPRPLVFAIAGALAGVFIRVIGVRRMTAGGTALIVVSLLMIASTAAALDTWVVIIAIALSGLGMGLVQPAIALSVANSVDDADLGVAGATQQMSVQVATSLGMNLLDSVQTGLVATLGIAGAFSRSYQLGAGLTAAGILFALLLPRHPARVTRRTATIVPTGAPIVAEAP